MITKKLALINVERLIIAIVLWPVFFIPLCFILYYTVNSNYAKRNDSIRQVPTFSETGSVSPGDLIFTFGLHFEGVLLSCFFLALYYFQKDKIESISNKILIEHDSTLSTVGKCGSICCGCFYRPAVKQTMLDWNYILLVLGLVTSFCMAMVGTVTLKVQPFLHGVFAFIMFICAVLHLLLFYFKIAWYTETRPYRLMVYKLCIASCVPFNMVMVVVAGSVLLSCRADERCQSYFENLMSVLEFTTSISLVVYVYCFIEDLRCISLSYVMDRIALEAQATENIGLTEHKAVTDAVALENNNPLSTVDVVLNSGSQLDGQV